MRVYIIDQKFSLGRLYNLLTGISIPSIYKELTDWQRNQGNDSFTIASCQKISQSNSNQASSEDRNWMRYQEMERGARFLTLESILKFP